MKRVGPVVAALAFAGALMGLGTQPAQAVFDRPAMTCAQLTGHMYFSVPRTTVVTNTRMSQFAYRVNGGAWTYSDWYFADYVQTYRWDGRSWLSYSARGVDGLTAYKLQSGAHVEGWERVQLNGGDLYWQSLGTCVVSSWDSVITYG